MHSKDQIIKKKFIVQLNSKEIRVDIFFFLPLGHELFQSGNICTFSFKLEDGLLKNYVVKKTSNTIILCFKKLWCF